MRRWAGVVLVGTAVLALAACGDDSGGSSLGGGDVPEDVQDEIDEQVDDAQERADDLADDLEEGIDELGDDIVGGDGEACSLLTAGEIEDEVGNAVEEGSSNITGCIWSSDPAETGVSIALVDLPDPSLCADVWSADPSYEELDGFGSPAFSSTNDLGGIPQADVIVCGDATQMALTVTGGFDDSQSTDDIQAQAEALTELALERL